MQIKTGLTLIVGAGIGIVIGIGMPEKTKERLEKFIADKLYKAVTGEERPKKKPIVKPTYHTSYSNYYKSNYKEDIPEIIPEIKKASRHTKRSSGCPDI